MNIGTVQIMWKEIGIGFIVLYVLRKLLDVYMIKKYEKLLTLFGVIEMDTLKLKAEEHLKLCDFFSVGPWNKSIYWTYNGLCWLLATISFVENNENDFLAYLGKIKKEQEFEMKSFALSLYYRSKGDITQAKRYYNVYLTSKHVNNDIAVVMNSIWHEKKDPELLTESINRFENPALKKLFTENHIS